MLLAAPWKYEATLIYPFLAPGAIASSPHLARYRHQISDGEIRSLIDPMKLLYVAFSGLLLPELHQQIHCRLALCDCVPACEPAWNIDPLAGVIGVQY